MNTLNEAARELNRVYNERFQSGYATASADMSRLDQLAKSIAASCQWWAESVRRIEGSKPIDAGHAADLLLETTFECLPDEALAYLTAAVRSELSQGNNQ